VISLDTFLKFKDRKINLVKIDVEGSELKVLKGMEEILKAHTIERLVIEIKPRFFKCFSYKKEDIYNLLYRYGYT
jgi:transposase-like protein